ncbi:hypothetical protein EW026_g3238 [Hermanssonia centrifuga]|uniref:Uncharacterized protein n=1 Tax=Hermanssonia centrifuga TaxID=98765 RepID=A0A4S4KKR5_9APHY|nr:hypothetical protein EW026_g3238 [Hermanssonia centrifuga]
MSLITARAKYSHIPVSPPYFPPSLLSYIATHDPINTAYTASNSSNPFLNKKILVLSGGSDPLVPFEHSRKFVEGLNVGWGKEQGGVKEVVVMDGVGHECTPEMVKLMANFLWEHSLSVGPR